MKKLVVLSGAGISAESGLKTFRDADGLWEGYDIDEVATASAWRKNPRLVLQFYNMRRKAVLAGQPNKAHFAIAQLQEIFDVWVVTQNVDDLHERAGSKKILHLHGELLKMRSEKNEALIYPIVNDIEWGDKAEDGAQLRPHIVCFEEPVPLMEEAIDIVKSADLFLVIGTSLNVYPAAGLINYVPLQIPKFLIDKNPPSLGTLYNLTTIQATATDGIERFVNLIKPLA